jgi:hypothetical protein
MNFATKIEIVDILNATVKFLDGSRKVFKGITSESDFESFLDKCTWKNDIKSMTYKTIRKRVEKRFVASVYGPCGDGAGFSY